MKCPICKSKKGKRVCLMTSTCICSACCGNERKKNICHPCSYYKEPERKYKDIPFYMPNEMDGCIEREEIANVIESAISTFDFETKDVICDDVPIRIIEQLLDVYYFKGQHEESNNSLLEAGYQYVLQAIEDELSNVPGEELTRILGAIYFVAKRRTTGKREYLSIIRQHVGMRLPDGSRIMVIPEGAMK